MTPLYFFCYLLILRSRWPKEQMTAQLQSIVAETEEKVLILHLSAGLVQPTSSGRNSALDLDNIISNIIAMLMQDPTFLALLEWLKTLPTSLHQVGIYFLIFYMAYSLFNRLMI